MQLEDQFYGFCETPSILTDRVLNEYISFNFPQPKEQFNLSQAQDEVLHPRNSVLGKRMESFFQMAVNQSEEYDLLSSNIQILSDKRTIGELDFLVYDKIRKKPLHVELVYKLYIYIPEFSDEIDRWVGPNRKDSYSEKLAKLQEHQFPLLFKPETNEYLYKLRLKPEDIEQHLCFKAKLFIPEGIRPKDEGIINMDCISGFWYSHEQFLNKNWEDNLFYSPRKQDWSCDPKHNADWMDYDSINAQIKLLFEKEKAPLIWMKSGNEIRSFFVVWW
ncbi:DUF1853 family protein [Christiangramia salexigens]|uniref:DUF1853 domain-containing protein n=1 Tax=Christiangramia salexigens TaxID=1913577 RepID=A0A1L3J2Z0_9FLAO|nr:DUF1853 family protein [Christiangramia salexigens]APG59484.1 hypothetical protein LPB144_03245 [Christiangramia salexigens]